ncbi:MAG: polysaccharide lyase family 1 protein [Candidatus Ornithomonoglobus sp.]
MKLNKAVAAALSAVMAIGAMSMPIHAEEKAKLLAFPGVEGGGKYTTGARGADEIEVYHVTNLNDDGEGSLRDAISKSGRIVVFDVGGIIELKSRLEFRASDITVLGQTAPGDGITITGYDALVAADNIIMRYLRIRPTDSQGGEPDGLGGRWVKNIVLDHCSVSWGVDEMLTLYSGSMEGGKIPSANVTVQYCLSSESLRMSSHIKGAHGYGGIVGGTDATWHHNLFAHNDSRNPRFDRNLKNTDVVNNVIYNFGSNIMYGAEPYSYNKQEEFSKPEYVSNINIRNNYIKFGPSTKQEIRSKIFEATNDGSVFYNDEVLKSNAYINGNFIFGDTEGTKDNTASEKNVMNRDVINLLDEPVAMGEYEIDMQSAEEAYEAVLANVGATLPKRDAADARVVADVRNGTGRIINQEEEVGGLVSIESSERVFEIPADWKAENGMGDADDADIAPSGYTWVEEYVNEWTAEQEAPSNPDITVLSPATADTDKTVDKTDAKGFWLVTDKPVIYNASAEGSDVIKTELYDGTELIASVESGTIKEELSLAPGTHYLTCLAYNERGEKTTSDTAIVYVTGADAEDITEIGDVPFEGKSRVWQQDGKTYIAGSGYISGTEDACAFDKKYVNGDFVFQCKIEDIPKYENMPLNGIMLRESADPGSKMVMISDTWRKYGENIVTAIRTETGGELQLGWMKNEEGEALSNSGSYDTVKYPMPKYMRMERKGDTLILSVSDDGTDWTNNARKSVEIDISDFSKSALVGFAVDSMNGRANEAVPMLPWFTIASFSEVKTEGVYDSKFTAAFNKEQNRVEINAAADGKATVVIAEYGADGSLVGTITKAAELKAGENTIEAETSVDNVKVSIFE